MYSIYIRSIKKTIKIFYRLVILLVTFIVAGIIALQSSVVQTRLADKVLTTLNESIDGDIKVGKITANPFKAVVIKDLAVIDKHPYESRVDTFFRAGYVTAKLNLRTLLSGNISIGAAKVTDGEFNLVIEPVMIGDSAYDAEGAQAAGVGFVGVLYGYGFRREAEILRTPGAKCARSAQEIVEEILQ